MRVLANILNYLRVPFKKRRMSIHCQVVDRLPEEEELERVQRVLFPVNTKADITDEELASVLPDCINLETVQLSGIPDTSDRTLKILAMASNNLRGIDLCGLQNITDIGILGLASQCLTLEWIRLNGVVALTDDAVSALVKSCPRLTELELDSCIHLTPLSIRDIWTFTRRLKRLKLSKCSQLTDKAFPSDASPNSSYSSRHPVQLDEKWLEQLPPLTLPPSYSHENLRVLDLSYCSRITDQAIAGIVKYAPKIQTLLLSGCTELTDEALLSVCNLGVHIDVLSLSHVDKITDRAVVQLVRSCNKLRSVDLAYCSNLTDMSVLELAGLPHLRRLNLFRVRRITDNAVFFIAEHTTGLERLNLSYCDGLSLDAIHLLMQKLGRLQRLTVTGVSSLERLGIKRFSDRCPAGCVTDKDLFRVFSRANIRNLCKFLDKEVDRMREAEVRNILFIPRSDDELDLY